MHISSRARERSIGPMSAGSQPNSSRIRLTVRHEPLDPLAEGVRVAYKLRFPAPRDLEAGDPGSARALPGPGQAGRGRSPAQRGERVHARRRRRPLRAGPGRRPDRPARRRIAGDWSTAGAHDQRLDPGAAVMIRRHASLRERVCGSWGWWRRLRPALSAPTAVRRPRTRRGLRRLRGRTLAVLATGLGVAALAGIGGGSTALADNPNINPLDPITQSRRPFVPQAPGPRRSSSSTSGPTWCRPGRDANRIDVDLPLATAGPRRRARHAHGRRPLGAHAPGGAHPPRPLVRLDPGNEEDNYPTASPSGSSATATRRPRPTSRSAAPPTRTARSTAAHRRRPGPADDLHAPQQDRRQPMLVYIVLDMTFIHGSMEQLNALPAGPTTTSAASSSAAPSTCRATRRQGRHVRDGRGRPARADRVDVHRSTARSSAPAATSIRAG